MNEMKTYNVSEVADMLNVNEETVRRWIRNGKLNADRRRGRGGSCISNAAIETMLKSPEFKKLHTDFVRMKLAEGYNVSNDENDDIMPEIEEDKNSSIEISKEDLKRKINDLIAMRDCLNKQIDELICLL